MNELEKSNMELAQVVQRLAADKAQLEQAILQMTQGGTGGGTATAGASLLGGGLGGGMGNFAQGSSIGTASLLQQAGGGMGMRAPPGASGFSLDQLGLGGAGGASNPSLQDLETLRYLSSMTGGCNQGTGLGGGSNLSATGGTLMDTIRRLGDQESRGLAAGVHNQGAGSLGALLGNTNTNPMQQQSQGLGGLGGLGLGGASTQQDPTTAATLELLLARQQQQQQGQSQQQQQQRGNTTKSDSASDLSKTENQKAV